MLLKERTVDFLARISANVIHGTIVLNVVIGSLSAPLPGNLTVIITVFLSLQVIIWVRAYANSISEDMANQQLTPWRERWKILLQPDWMMLGAVVPITFFGLALSGLITQSTALGATKAVLLVVLLFFGFVARRRRGGNILQSVSSGLVIMLLGYVVIQIKLWSRSLPAIGL